MRQALVIAQVALTVVLLCGAGLLAKTILALDSTGAGFDQRGMLTMEVQVPTTRYNAERRTAFFRQAIEALQALPGVEGAAAANSLAVIGGAAAAGSIGSERRCCRNRSARGRRFALSPGYFRTIGVPMLRGRDFADLDDASRPAFVVNKAFADKFLSDVDH